jgi:hypothetical protein
MPFSMCAPVHFSPPSAGGIDDHRSSLALRPYLHKLFDSREFAAAPKYAADDGAPPTLAVHVLIHNRQRELIQLYQNIILQPLSGIATEFLFARFARAIFPSPRSSWREQVGEIFESLARVAARLKCASAPLESETGFGIAVWPLPTHVGDLE